MERMKSESHHSDEARHGESKIEMRAHWFDLCVQDEAAHGGEQDDVRKSHHERQPSDPSEFGDLNQHELAVQCGAEHVPTPTGKDYAPQILVRDPRGREKEGKPKIIYRAQPG